MAADGIVVLAVLTTYRRLYALVVVCIDGRIYWQSSLGLGRSYRPTGRPCWASCAFCLANFLSKPPLTRFACSMVEFDNGGLPFGSHVFHQKKLCLFLMIVERFVDRILPALSVSFIGERFG